MLLGVETSPQYAVIGTKIRFKVGTRVGYAQLTAFEDGQ